MNKLEPLLEQALKIAMEAHGDQKDKGNNPYIFHPIRVSAKCDKIEEKIVALLHDVIEDSYIDVTYLRKQGFPIYIIEAVLSVTRKERETYEDFIKRTARNEIGRIVKIKDLEDNMDITRLNELTEKDFNRLQKYHRSYKYLINYER